MRRYRFRLASVLRVRQVQEDVASGVLLRAHLALHDRTTALAAASAHYEQRPPLPGPVVTPSFLASRWRDDCRAEEVRSADRARAEAAAAADQSRRAWTEAARRVAVLERLDDRRRAEHRLAAERASARELDDLVVGRFRRLA